MPNKETRNVRSLRKRVKKEYTEDDDEYYEETPKEKKAKLVKTSSKKGAPSSYSGDSKEVLGNNSFEKAIALFEKTDPALSDFIKSCDDPNTLMDVKMNAYQTLVKIIISQQLSTSAARSIMTKFIKLFLKEGESTEPDHQFKAHPHFPTPEIVKETSPERLRSAGISFRKAGYLLIISEKFSDKNYLLNDDKKLNDMSNEDIARLLIDLKGIGPWAVDIFLLLYMKRSDIFPISDAGIRKGLSMLIQNTLGKKGKKLNYLSIEEMEKYSENWKPYRSVASWYLMKVSSPERVKGYLKIRE
jgi:DNA-3-methyladenine glycosylase II